MASCCGMFGGTFASLSVLTWSFSGYLDFQLGTTFFCSWWDSPCIKVLNMLSASVGTSLRLLLNDGREESLETDSLHLFQTFPLEWDDSTRDHRGTLQDGFNLDSSNQLWDHKLHIYVSDSPRKIVISKYRLFRRQDKKGFYHFSINVLCGVLG